MDFVCVVVLIPFLQQNGAGGSTHIGDFVIIILLEAYKGKKP